jgi:hypothetical protein
MAWYPFSCRCSAVQTNRLRPCTCTCTLVSCWCRWHVGCWPLHCSAYCSQLLGRALTYLSQPSALGLRPLLQSKSKYVWPTGRLALQLQHMLCTGTAVWHMPQMFNRAMPSTGMCIHNQQFTIALHQVAWSTSSLQYRVSWHVLQPATGSSTGGH